ncbi:PREDICTED: syntaxin-5-like, partial [Priapulus caudatus]|uniref:Syntaxin-5-like n=1 Tax=Priapulus caudatus TaxID=37621 RepID=A0ABM1EWN5_PRICU
MLTRRRRTSEGESQPDYNQARNGHRTNGVPHQRALNVGAASGVARYASPARSGPLDADMTCRDRTTEFMSTLKSMQSRMGSSQLSSVYQNHSDLKQRSEFMQIAKRIGRDLSSTFSKLEKLTILAKKKSLFDDRPVEIQELTYIIKQDINSLNKQIASLQELSRSKARIGGQHRQTHSNAVVVALQSKLATMSNNFKSVLEVRTENLKQQRSRREQYSQGPVASSLPPSAMTGHYTGSVLLQEDSTSSQEVAIDMGMGPGSSRYQEQLQLVDEQ